jgi:hypothetical protein
MSANNELFKNTNVSILNIDNYQKSKSYVIKNNYWNNHYETILINLQKNSNKLFKEYQKAHLKYKYRLKIYRIPIIILSALSGFLSISNSGYIPLDYNKWISMIVGFVNLMVTIISLIENFKKIDVNMNKTYTAYIDLKRLHDEVSLILNTPQHERDDNGNDTCKAYFKRYELYLNDAPILKKVNHDYLDTNSPDNTTVTLLNSNSTANLQNIDMLYNIDNTSLSDIESQKIINNKKHTFRKPYSFRVKKNIAHIKNKSQNNSNNTDNSENNTNNAINANINNENVNNTNENDTNNNMTEINDNIIQKK